MIFNINSNTTAAAIASRRPINDRPAPPTVRPAQQFDGSFAPSRQVATYVTIALQASQARQRMRSIREEATAAGINTALTLPVKSVDVRTMQFVILAHSPREMSQTDRIHPRYFLLRVRVSIRPRYFVNAKKP